MLEPSQLSEQDQIDKAESQQVQVTTPVQLTEHTYEELTMIVQIDFLEILKYADDDVFSV